jgi:hypothetical protein
VGDPGTELELALAERERRRRQREGVANDFDAYQVVSSDEAREAILDRIKKTAEPVSWGTRMEAKLKGTEAGAEGNLKHYFGEKNVVPVGSNNYAIRHKGETYLLEDAEKTSAVGEFVRDLADVAPEVAEALVGSLGAPAGAALGVAAGYPVAGPGAVASGIAGGAVGSMAGRAGRLGVSAALPGEDFPEGGMAQDIAITGALDAATAGATHGAGWLGRAVWKYLNPLSRSAAESYVARAAKESSSEAAQQGERIAAEADMPLNAVEKSLGPESARATATAIGSSTKVADLAARVATKRQGVLTGKMNALLDAVEKTPMSNREATARLALGLAGEVGAAKKALASKAEKLYSAFDAAAGGRPLFEARATVTRIGELLGEMPTAEASKASKLMSLAEDLNKPLTGRRFKDLRTWVGRQVKSKSMEPGHAAEIYKAMGKDLDAMIGRAATLPEAAGSAAALKSASAAYAAGKAEIKALENSTLAVAVKKLAPKKALESITDADLLGSEKLAKSLLSAKMSAGELAELSAHAARVAPGAMKSVRYHALKDLLSGAMEAPSSVAGAKGAVESAGGVYNPAAVADMVLGQKPATRLRMEKIDALLADDRASSVLRAYGRWSQRVASGADLVSGTPRVASKAEKVAGSPAVGATAGGAVAGSVGAGVGLMVSKSSGEAVRKMSVPAIAARALIDPEASVTFLSLANPPKQPSVRWLENTSSRLLARLARLEAESPEEDR